MENRAAGGRGASSEKSLSESGLPGQSTSPILAAFSSYFRRDESAPTPILPQVETIDKLWDDASRALRGGDSDSAIRSYHQLLVIANPADRESNVFFAAASCQVADLLLRQGRGPEAMDILYEYNQHGSLLPIAYHPWALLLGAVGRHLAGEESGAQLDLVRFRKGLEKVSEAQRHAVLGAADNGIKTMIALSCESLAVEVVGDVLEHIKTQAPREFPEHYLDYLLCHARLLLSQNRSDEAYKRVEESQVALEETFFPSEHAIIDAREQICQVLVDLGKFHEALRECDAITELAVENGLTAISLCSRIERCRVHYSVGSESEAISEFVTVGRALNHLLPRDFFAAVKAGDREALLELYRDAGDSRDQQDFYDFTTAYSRLLLVKLTQLMDDPAQARQVKIVSNEIQVIDSLLKEVREPGRSSQMLLIARAYAAVITGDPQSDSIFSELDRIAPQFISASPSHAQAHFLMAIDKQRKNDPSAVEHFNQADQIFRNDGAYCHTVPCLTLLALKGLYQYEAQELPAYAETMTAALSLREDFGIVFSDRGRNNILQLIEVHQTLNNDQQAEEYLVRLQEIDAFLKQRSDRRG